MKNSARLCGFVLAVGLILPGALYSQEGSELKPEVSTPNRQGDATRSVPAGEPERVGIAAADPRLESALSIEEMYGEDRKDRSGRADEDSGDDDSESD